MKKVLFMCLALVLTSSIVASGAIMAPQKKCSCSENCSDQNVSAQVYQEKASTMPSDNIGIDIKSKSAFLVEANSGRVLFSKEADKQLPIASMVKITTLAVIYDALASGEIDLDQMVMVSPTASGMGGSQAFLDFDNEYKVDELIKSIIVASANDSCVALAEQIAGSETEFVNRMNALATRLGMVNTNYVNCTGLPAVGAYSTAGDVAKVYAYMMQSPYYGIHEKVWMYDLTHPSGRVTGLTNTNRHARFFDGITGGKTGFTAEAGHCISVSATRGNLRPIAVIIGAPDSKTRFYESGKLMEYVFGSYQNELIVSRNTVLAIAKVRGAFQDKVELFAKTNYYDLVKKGDKSKPEVKVVVNEEIRAPFTTNDAMGKVVVTREGKVIAEIDLVSGSDVAQLDYWGAVKKVVGQFKLAG